MMNDELIFVDDFDFKSLSFKPLARHPGQTGSMIYADCVCSFDIETTRIEEREQAIMYVWQWAIEETVIFNHIIKSQ